MSEDPQPNPLALKAAYAIKAAPGRIRRLVVPAAVGAGAFVVATVGLWWGLEFSLPISAGIGVVLGGAGTMLSVAPKPAPEPTDAERVAAVLDGIRQSAIAQGERIRGLRAPIWRGSEGPAAKARKRLMGVCEQLHGIASLPDIVSRTHVDGDLLMLQAIATETLPNVVELASENDRMYSSASPEAKKEITALADGIGEQARILSEAVGRIESDIVEGTSRDIRQHLEYVRARFSKLGIDDAADFDRAFRELEG